MSIISNSNAAKAKHLMGSYSSRGAGVSSGKVSQFYKEVFLQEGDRITNLYYAGRVGSVDYLEDLEVQQVLPFEKSVVTFHETSPSGLDEILTLGIRISAMYDEDEHRYYDYSADLCGCPGDELDLLQLTTLSAINTYSNILAKLVEEQSSTYVVTKIHDREWCDALFSKISLYYGMNGINYLSNFYGDYGRTVYDPFFEYKLSGSAVYSMFGIPIRLNRSQDAILFNEKFIYTLASSSEVSRQFCEAIYASAEKDIADGDLVHCLVYKTPNFEDQFDNKGDCLRVIINLQYQQDNGSVYIYAACDGYSNNIHSINIHDIATIIDGHVTMYTDYFNDYGNFSGDISDSLNFSYSDSNPFFVNSLHGFITIGRFSSTIYSTYVYTAGRGPITAPITDADLAVPISVLNLIEDTSLGAPFIDNDGATFLPLLIIDGSGLPSEHPFYGMKAAMTAIDSYFDQDNIPIYIFASYGPSIGSVLVNVKYVSPMFEITSIKINDTSTPIESFAGAQWEVLFVTRPANIII